MRKKIVGFLFASALLVAMAVPVLGSGTASAHPVLPPDAVPGEANCHGKIVSGQAKEHGGSKKASQDHGFASLKEYHNAIKAYCEG